MVIVGRSSATEIAVDVKRAFATSNASAKWRLGAWGGTPGWPGAAG